MNQFLIRSILFSFLTLFFVLTFYWMNANSLVIQVFYAARQNLEETQDRRHKDRRRSILLQLDRNGVVAAIEKRIQYSGLINWFPLLNPYVYFGGKVVIASGIYFIGALLQYPVFLRALLVAGGLFVLYLLENIMIARNYNRTEDSLIKLLDCLGSYSVTTSEITWILSQVCEYMEEPVKGVLEECCLEAQVTGDYSMALLYTAEKLQHPKFRELLRNLEISLRYCADLTVMVAQSKRSITEYMRMRQERKALVREAWVNILILGAMALIILKAVGVLLSVPMTQMLFHTWPGIVCVIVIVGILLMFYMQIRKLV